MVAKSRLDIGLERFTWLKKLRNDGSWISNSSLSHSPSEILSWRVKFGFQVGVRAGIKKQVAYTISPLEPDRTEKTQLEDDTSELVGSLVQLSNAQVNEHDGILANKCCVWKSCDITVNEQQNAWTGAAVFMQQKPFIYWRKRPSYWNNQDKSSLQTANSRLQCRQSDVLPHATIITLMASLEGHHQLMAFFKSLTLSHYVPASYTCLITPYWQDTPGKDIYGRNDGKHFHWTQMTNDVYKPVHKCLSYVQNGS